MGIFSKRKPIVEDFSGKIAKVFAKDARYTGTQEGKTVDLAPQLKPFGEYILCENTFEAFLSAHKFRCIPTLKIYETECNHTHNRYGFYGCGLRVECIQHIHRIYAYTKKPFTPPEGKNWIKCPSVGSLRVFALDGELSLREQQSLKVYRDWLESGLCVSQSYRYALYLENQSLSVFFWEPEIYPFEYFLDIVKEAMLTFPQMRSV